MGVIEVVMDCIDVMLEWTPEDLSLQYYRLRSLLCCMLGSECVVSYPSEVERRMREQLDRLESGVCYSSECDCVGEEVCSSSDGDCEEDACSSDDDVSSSSEVSEEGIEMPSRMHWCPSLFSLLIMVLLVLGACWMPCRLEEGEVVCWSGGLRVVDENVTQVREETELEWGVPEESEIVEEEESEAIEENQLIEEKSGVNKESENQIVEEKNETIEESEKTETETTEENDPERETTETIEKNELTETIEESENQIVEEKTETTETNETNEEIDAKRETIEVNETNELPEDSTEKENNTTSEDGDMTEEKNDTDEKNDPERENTTNENQTQEQLPPNTLISSSLLHFLRPHWFLLLTSSSLLLFVTWWFNRETVETVELEEEVSTPQQDSFEGDSTMEVTRNMDDETYHSLLRILVKWVFGLSLTTRSQTPRKAQ